MEDFNKHYAQQVGVFGTNITSSPNLFQVGCPTHKFKLELEQFTTLNLLTQKLSNLMAIITHASNKS